MTSTTTKPAAVRPEAETAGYLFDDWFDPIEAGLRDRERAPVSEEGFVLLVESCLVGHHRDDGRRRRPPHLMAQIGDLVGECGLALSDLLLRTIGRPSTYESDRFAKASKTKFEAVLCTGLLAGAY